MNISGREQAEQTKPSETVLSPPRAERLAQWDKVRDRLRQEFGARTFDSWFKNLEPAEDGDGTLVMTVPTPFMLDWIERNYAHRIRQFWQREDSALDRIAFRVAGRRSAVAASEAASEAAGQAISEKGQTNGATAARADADPTVDSFGGSLEPRYTFDTFVVGKSNELAYAAAQRVAESDTVPFNPLFLHGSVGLGKTHLMHAIAAEVRRRDPDRKVMYLSAERFMFQFISALRYKDTVAFKQQFRSVDLLMIDDVQFIANKNSTQEEFFHTFNALVDSRRQVVISADRSPTDLEGIEERIVSRLGWGLVADIHPTDYELRLGILQSKAERETAVKIPDEVMQFLARRITSNVRELEGALNRVMAYAELSGHPVSLDMTRDLLQDLLRANDRKITIDDIQRRVADYYNLRLPDMLSERRARNIARPRQVAMYLSKQLTARSLPEIGRKFNGRDHTTVMHAVRKIDELRQTDSALDDDISRLMRMLEC